MMWLFLVPCLYHSYLSKSYPKPFIRENFGGSGLAVDMHGQVMSIVADDFVFRLRLLFSFHSFSFKCVLGTYFHNDVSGIIKSG